MGSRSFWLWRFRRPALEDVRLLDGLDGDEDVLARLYLEDERSEWSLFDPPEAD